MIFGFRRDLRRWAGTGAETEAETRATKVAPFDEDAAAGGGDTDEDAAVGGGDTDEDTVAGGGDADEDAAAAGEIVGASAESDVFISCPYVSLSKGLGLAIPLYHPHMR